MASDTITANFRTYTNELGRKVVFYVDERGLVSVTAELIDLLLHRAGFIDSNPITATMTFDRSEEIGTD